MADALSSTSIITNHPEAKYVRTRRSLPVHRSTSYAWIGKGRKTGVKIVFDMDNTLFDELGRWPRPGIRELLERLRKDGHTLALWTSSTAMRARSLLADHLRARSESCDERDDLFDCLVPVLLLRPTACISRLETVIAVLQPVEPSTPDTTILEIVFSIRWTQYRFATCRR